GALPGRRHPAHPIRCVAAGGAGLGRPGAPRRHGAGVRGLGHGGAGVPQRGDRRTGAHAGPWRAPLRADPVSATSIPSDQPQQQLPASDVWDGPPVVLVHDWIGGVNGAERVLKELATLFPSAPILALMADRRILPQLGIEPARVHQSYLGRVPNAIALRKVMLPFLADAVQTLDVGDASLIVSSSHAVAKTVPHRSYQRHLSYVYSPMRYAHDLLPQYLRE